MPTAHIKMISKKILTRHYFYTTNRFFTTQSIKQDSQRPKPFESIPKLSLLNVLTGFAPGGQFYGKEFKEFHSILREKYGSIVKFPAIFGRPSILFSYDAEDFEKVNMLIYLFYILSKVFNLHSIVIGGV